MSPPVVRCFYCIMFLLLGFSHFDLYYLYSNTTKSKIIGYNELLRLVHYNQQGVGYNETEKPKRFTKFHYI